METSREDESTQKTSSQNPASQAVDLIAETANQILDAVSWLGQRMNTSGNVFKIEEAKGAVAEVSLSIPAGGTGEVVLVLGQTRKNYPAKAAREGENFARGSKVKIVDVAVSTMFVERVMESI